MTPKQLEKMTPAERLHAMEMLWSSLGDGQASPTWHGAVVAERKRAVAQGRARFVSLEKFRTKFSR